MGKISTKLIESFGYIAEASPEELIRQQPAMSYAANKLGGADATGGNATGYDPNKIQYAYQDGKANPDWPGNKPPEDQKDTPTDQKKDKPKPQKSKLFDPNIQAIQNLFNKLGITDNAGAKINPDGVWGWRTEEAKHNFYLKYKRGSPEDQQKQAFADKVKPEFQWRLIADKDGRTARGGADMSKAKDPAIGEPSPSALKAMGLPANSGQGTQPSATGNANLDVLNKVPNPTNGMEYWVNGSRFEYRAFPPPNDKANGWYKNLDPSDKLQWNKNRALSSTGYTGSDDDEQAKQQWVASKKKDTQVAATQTAGQSTQPKESSELDIIRKLSGM